MSTGSMPATQARLRASRGLRRKESLLGPMQYPAPSRLPLGPLMDYGYEGTAIFPLCLTASQQFPLGDTTLLKAHVQWLVCREICLPGKAFLG